MCSNPYTKKSLFDLFSVLFFLVIAAKAAYCGGQEDVSQLLFDAIKESQNKYFVGLLRLGANPNIRAENQMSLVAFAAEQPESEYLKQALEHGGDPNILNMFDGYRPTPIFNAISSRSMKNIILLADTGADLTVHNGLGKTPLLAAAAVNFWEAAFFMLQRVKQISIQDAKSLVFHIEQFPLNKQSQEFNWRNKVVESLKMSGMEVKPRN